MNREHVRRPAVGAVALVLCLGLANAAPAQTPANVVRGADGNLRPAAGYTWAGTAWNDYRVRWVPGAAHPVHPNVVAAAAADRWVAAPGYRWAGTAATDFRTRWAPGQAHPALPNVVAASDEGQWVAAPGYKWFGTRADDFRTVRADHMSLGDMEDLYATLAVEREACLAGIEEYRRTYDYWSGQDGHVAQDRATYTLGGLLGKQGRLQAIDQDMAYLADLYARYR